MRTCHELRRPAPRALPTITGLAAVCLLTTAAGLVGCSSGSGDSNETNSGPSIAPPDPNGVMLPGDPSDPALGELIDMQPSPVAPADVLDGLLTTRLEALFAPGVTVQEVNDALAANDAAIVSMSAGFPAVSLVVPAAADENEAQMRADALAATPAFGAVTISYATVEGPIVMPLGGGGLEPSIALDLARIPPAKNAADLLGVGGPRLSVVVADEFVDLVPDPRISAQSFASPNGQVSVGGSGNDGFAAAGIIGADADPNSVIVPVHPRAGETLDIRCVPMSGLTWIERVMQTAYALDAASGPIVLYTGRTYEPEESYRTKGWRSCDALFWRYMIASRSVTFVHVQPAGDHGLDGTELAEARWCSPFALSESVGDLAVGLTGEDLEQYELALIATGGPGPVGNLRVVGSRQEIDPQPSDFSSPGADLSMVGELVYSTCAAPGVACENGIHIGVSTRAAAAQVAGLYAYLWGIKGSMSKSELLSIVDIAYFSGVEPQIVDAYQAVLALDPSLGSAAVRPELLDVAAGADVYSEIGDGVFDDHDIAVLVAGIENASLVDGASIESPFDLNGDGLVGSTITRPFDLDVNVPPAFTTVQAMHGSTPVDFDEAAVTDIEIVCYYSLTPLFTGDTERRDQLLADCLPAGDVELETFTLSGDGDVEIGITGEQAGFEHVDQNISSTVTADVSLGGTAVATVSQDGLVIVGGGQSGIERISTSGYAESSCNAVVPGNGGPYGEAGGQTRLELMVDEASTPMTVAFTHTYTPVSTGQGAGAYGAFRVRVFQSSSNLSYMYTATFDESSAGGMESISVPLTVEPGAVEITISYDSETFNDDVPTGSTLNVANRMEWDFDVTFEVL